jgi:thiol-disulfide isomerase/thioredoxin
MNTVTLSRVFRSAACFCLFALTLAGGAQATRAADGATEPLRPFDVKSLSAIRETSKGKPFLLAFWSLHCAPCKEEMPMFKALKAKYPEARIVLVATDDVDEHPAVLKFLAKHQLGAVETWAFADEFAERVRFSIDKSWRGELPKTYFFDAEHKATAHTGKLELAMVESWLAGAGSL